MEIGDKVRFLNDVGGGVVTGFQGKDIALVRTDDGFELPTLVKECVVIDTNEYNIAPKAKPSRPAKAATPEAGTSVSGTGLTAPSAKFAAGTCAFTEEEETEPADRPVTFRRKPLERRGGDALNFFLAFVPDDVEHPGTTDFNLYVINHSNYTMRYAISSTEGGAYALIADGEVEANCKVRLQSVSREALAPFERLGVQALAFRRERPFAPVPPVFVELRIDGTKFFRRSAFGASEFFNAPAMVVEVVKDNVPVREVQVDARQLKQAMTGHGAEERPAESRAVRKADRNAPVEVDLHATELLDSMSGLQPKDILEFQLKTFREVMEQHKGERGRRIVFIHGKGEGVLRAAIIAELKARYKQCRYQDASFREYGFGATLVIL